MRSKQTLRSKARRLDDIYLVDVYLRFSPGLFRYAARLLGDPDLAEDCVAEAFSRLMEAMKNGSGPFEHLQAYLYKIAHNWITDQFRKEIPVVTGIHASLKGNGKGTARIVHEKIEFERVRSALVQLPSDQRQVIVLKYLESWSNQEIAAVLGKSVGSVRVLHHRGVAGLKRLLAEPESVL